jgi:hypothetical protein
MLNNTLQRQTGGRDGLQLLLISVGWYKTMKQYIATVGMVHVVVVAVLVLTTPKGWCESPQAATDSSPYAVKKDTVLAENAVGPSWISWKTPSLPNADVVYVERENWNLWVMDENGGHKRCLTCYGDNVLRINFPLDEDSRDPKIHWKGDPEAHPFLPIIFLRRKTKTVSTSCCAIRRVLDGTMISELWTCVRSFTTG